MNFRKLFILFSVTKFNEVIIGILITTIFLFLLSGSYLKVYNDDALFYGIIAKHFIGTGNFTFDGIAKTNGFHWIGMITSVIISSIINYFNINNFEDFFKLKYFFDAAIILSLVLLLTKKVIINRINPNNNLLINFLLIVSFVFALTQILLLGLGMELVFLPFLIVVLIFKITAPETKAASTFILAGLIILSRIDYLSVIITITLLSGFVNNSFISKKNLYLISGAITGVLLVFTLNYLAAGSINSTSSTIKSYGFNFQVDPSFIISPFNIFELITYIFLVIYTFRKRDNNLSLFFISSVSFVVFSQVTLMRMFAGGNMGNWYDVVHLSLGLIALYMLFIAILSDKIITMILKRFILIFLTIVIVLITPRLMVKVLLGSVTTYHTCVKEFCSEIISIVPHGENIAIDDLPGIVTIYTKHNIIALDGLVNSPGYVENYLLKGRISNYLKNVGCRWLIIINNRINTKAEKVLTASVGFSFNKKVPGSIVKFKRNQIFLDKYCENLNLALIKLF